MGDDEAAVDQFRDGYVVERHDGEIVGVVFRKGKVWYSMLIRDAAPGTRHRDPARSAGRAHGARRRPLTEHAKVAGHNPAHTSVAQRFPYLMSDMFGASEEAVPPRSGKRRGEQMDWLATGVTVPCAKRIRRGHPRHTTPEEASSRWRPRAPQVPR